MIDRSIARPHSARTPGLNPSNSRWHIVNNNPRYALVSTKTMSEARRSAKAEYQRARKHEVWLQEARAEFRRQLFILTHQRRLWITRKLLVLLTLEPHLLESLRQRLRALPSESTRELCLNMLPSSADRFCKDPPSDTALQATATELANMESSINSLSTLRLKNATISIVLPFLATSSESQPGNVQSTFSIKSLRQLYVYDLIFPDAESSDAFCLGIQTSSVELLWMFRVSIPPELQEQGHWLVAIRWWILIIQRCTHPEQAQHFWIIIVWSYRIMSIPSLSGYGCRRGPYRLTFTATVAKPRAIELS